MPAGHSREDRPLVATTLTSKVAGKNECDEQDGDDDGPYGDDPIEWQLELELDHQARQSPALLVLRGAGHDELLQFLPSQESGGHV